VFPGHTLRSTALGVCDEERAEVLQDVCVSPHWRRPGCFQWGCISTNGTSAEKEHGVKCFVHAFITCGFD
jgi:hypothetical protein